MKARILGLFRIIGLGVAAAMLAVAAASAQAPAPDVGLITQLSDPVTYWNQEEQKAPVPAKAFMKIRQGDNFKLRRSRFPHPALLQQRAAGDLERPSDHHRRRRRQHRRRPEISGPGSKAHFYQSH